MIKVGDQVRVTVVDPIRRTYQRSFEDKEMITIPLGTVVMVMRVDSDTKGCRFFWEGHERLLCESEVEKVCLCSPSNLLLLGCTC
jgi:hypothetical protein